MGSKPWKPTVPATTAQIDYLLSLARDHITSEAEVLRLAGIDDLAKLTKGDASRLIGMLRTSTYKQVREAVDRAGQMSHAS